MKSLTLEQARRLLKYSAALYFLPVQLASWFPGKFGMGGALVGVYVMWVWRDNFTRRVIEAEVSLQYSDDEGPTHTATSAVSDTQIGFYGSAHADEDE